MSHHPIAMRPSVGVRSSCYSASYRRFGAATAAVALACGCDHEPESENTDEFKQAVAGNIHPAAIQIDGPQRGSDVSQNSGVPLNPGATIDWVLDGAANAGTGCLRSDAVATCIEPGVTGAAGGAGRWNGLRLVDGIGAADADIFVAGGKENDPDSWNVSPGSVGSAKFDLTQAYLANNQSTLYFGMDRRGNNGTTAFDFEFNQRGPAAAPDCPQSPLVPCRSVSDVLFTFEMQGSGNNGSATPHIYTWDGAKFVEEAPQGIVSSINSMPVAGPPWGHVDSHGDWVLGDMERFTLAEAAAPIAFLPGVNACGGKAFVQVRTRSSATPNSDLKDTTKVFEFLFGSTNAEASLTPSCDQGFHYEATGTDANGDPIPSPICQWTFSNGTTSNQCSGYMPSAPGLAINGSVLLADPASPDCAAYVTTASVDVYPALTAVANLDAACAPNFTYSGWASGGSNSAAVKYDWQFSGAGNMSQNSATNASGTVTVGTTGTEYTGTLTATDVRPDGLVCTATASDTATPFGGLSVNLARAAEAGGCNGDTITYEAQVTGGTGPFTYTWSDQSLCPGNTPTCTMDPGDALYCGSHSVSVTVTDASGVCGPATSETETYSMVTIVTASDN